jgi:hypothetical protein
MFSSYAIGGGGGGEGAAKYFKETEEKLFCRHFLTSRLPMMGQREAKPYRVGPDCLLAQPAGVENIRLI